jgi:hypothetical protein
MMDNRFIKMIGLTVWVTILSVFSVEAVELDSLNRNPEYVNAIVQRSEKIVEKLGVTDRNVCNEVTKIIANRYFELKGCFHKNSERNTSG